MPKISIGTWLSKQGDDAYEITSNWLKLGHRGIDTALVYFDQPAVSKAIQDAGLKREDVFITTKIPTCSPNAKVTIAAVEADLHALNTSYIDLLLVHSPVGIKIDHGCETTWKALESLVKLGQLRAIGISNFGAGRSLTLFCADGCEIPPAVNQIEYSVLHHDDETIEFCRTHNITVEAYSPLGGTHSTHGSVFTDPTVTKIAADHNVSAAQVALRWIVQRGDTLTVLSTSSEHQANDADLWSFELTAREMGQLDGVAVA